MVEMIFLMVFLKEDLHSTLSFHTDLYNFSLKLEAVNCDLQIDNLKIKEITNTFRFQRYIHTYMTFKATNLQSRILINAYSWPIPYFSSIAFREQLSKVGEKINKGLRENKFNP